MNVYERAMTEIKRQANASKRGFCDRSVNCGCFYWKIPGEFPEAPKIYELLKDWLRGLDLLTEPRFESALRDECWTLKLVQNGAKLS
jgi:hypothetical protein